MSTKELRENIHRFVEQADVSTLKRIFAVIESEKGDVPTIPQWFYEELNQRRKRHLNNQSKSYSWEQVKSAINDL